MDIEKKEHVISKKKFQEIKTEIQDKIVIVSIKDNGIGFTEEEKGKIFQHFGKIERYGQGLELGIDGTGLGLYISIKIIEAHGGEIWMESEGRNKGSTIYFSLPLIND
ncbi:MAG: sensor histidine kinase [Promethearchaeota archaeon]